MDVLGAACSQQIQLHWKLNIELNSTFGTFSGICPWPCKFLQNYYLKGFESSHYLSNLTFVNSDEGPLHVPDIIGSLFLHLLYSNLSCPSVWDRFNKICLCFNCLKLYSLKNEKSATYLTWQICSLLFQRGTDRLKVKLWSRIVLKISDRPI